MCLLSSISSHPIINPVNTQNHPCMLLKCTFGFSSFEWSISFCVCNKLPGYLEAANVGTLFLSNEG